MVEAPRPAPSPAVPDRASVPPTVNHYVSPHTQAAERTANAGVSAPPTADGSKTGYSFSNSQPAAEQQTNQQANNILRPGDVAPTRPLPQDEDPDLREKPYAIVPKTVLQPILNELPPGKEIKFTFATEVSESFRDNPTAKDRPELAVYGIKDNNTSWYLGLKNRPNEVVESEAVDDELPLPSETTLRKADDVGVSRELIEEIENQIPDLSKRGVASLIGDVMSTLTEPPNADPDLYEHEYELPTGIVADGYQPGLAVEVKSDKVDRVLAGAYEVGQQADAAQLETGEETDALLVVYPREPEAWKQKNEKHAA